MVATLLVGAAPAEAAKQPLELGLFDPQFQAASDADRNFVFDRAQENAGVVLTVVPWSQVAPATSGGGFDATDPADPAYNWTAIDRAVRGADSRGLEVILTVTRAPEWAEGGDRPGSAAPGTWKPRSGDVRDFAVAIARRYEGGFIDPDSIPEGALPQVRSFQAWTEPNLSGHLTPQSVNGKAASPEVYRDVLNSFYDGIQSVSTQNRVITAGTGPYGDPEGGNRVRPLFFWREIMCLEGRKKLTPKACPNKAKFDILAHHPINTSGPPKQSALDPDDVTSADLGNLTRVLRKAEKSGQTGTPGKHELWATEFWWRSDPPQGDGVAPNVQARYIAQSLYLFWKAGATLAVNLRVRDVPVSESLQAGTGIYFRDGEAKPSARAFRFPFVANTGPGRDTLWTRAPVAGTLRFERRRDGEWKGVASRQVDAGEVSQVKVNLPSSSRTRASIGDQKSFEWKDK